MSSNVGKERKITFYNKQFTRTMFWPTESASIWSWFKVLFISLTCIINKSFHSPQINVPSMHKGCICGTEALSLLPWKTIQMVLVPSHSPWSVCFLPVASEPPSAASYTPPWSSLLPRHRGWSSLTLEAARRDLTSASWTTSFCWTPCRAVSGSQGDKL